MSNTNTYTDQQLQLALAKMLPKLLTVDNRFGSVNRVMWRETNTTNFSNVEETEWLHVCWLVEGTLTQNECSSYNQEIVHVSVNPYPPFDKGIGWLFHASWQQRAIALAKVKGIEIV